MQTKPAPMNPTPKPAKPPKSAIRLDPFAAAADIDKRLGVAPAFTSTATQDNAQQRNMTHVATAHDNTTQIMMEQSEATRDSAEQGKATTVKPTHGARVRVTGYISTIDAEELLRLAAEQDRSDSYMVGKLITEALHYRRAALREKGGKA